MGKRGRPFGPDLTSAKHQPPARICSGCAAIIERGDKSYPDNHWEWCEGGEAVDITPEVYAAALLSNRTRET